MIESNFLQHHSMKKVNAMIFTLMVLFSPLAGCTGGDGPADVLGCMDSTANNYMVSATDEDGSCDYDLDDDGVLDVDEILGCMDSTANNYMVSATDEDGSCDYDFNTVFLRTWGSAQESHGLGSDSLMIGDTVYFISDDLWSFNSESGYTSHPVEGIQLTWPNEIVNMDDVLYFSAEEVIEGARTYEYATFAHDLSNSTTWRIPDNSHLSNFEWGFTFEGHDFFLSDNTVRILNDDGTSFEVYNHTQGVWCQSCGEVGVTEHGLVFLASDGDETGNHMELWVLDLDGIGDGDERNYASAVQLTELNLSDNFGTMFIDILSITNEGVVFGTPEGWNLGSVYLSQYSFANDTIWQIHPDLVNLELHQILQGYDASDDEVLYFPNQTSILIYDSSTGLVHGHQFGPTSHSPNLYIADEEIIVEYRPLTSSDEGSTISYIVGINHANGTVRNITSFDQSDLLSSDTEYPAEQQGQDGGIVSFDQYILLRARGQLLVHDTESGRNWVEHNLSMTIEVKYFQCDNGEQILFYLVNDWSGTEDCSDGSDEVDWDESDSPGFPGTFQCDDGTLIDFWDINNDWHQCSNGEDEWYPSGYNAMRDGWDLLVLGNCILFRLGWEVWYLRV